MAGQQLGGLVSMLQGLDMSPFNNARQYQMQRGQLNENNRASQAMEALEGMRLDFAKSDAMANRALAERELDAKTGLAREEMQFNKEERQKQRELDTTLAEMQLEGRMDLQDLTGAQEIAQLNLQGVLNQQVQESKMKHDQQMQDQLVKAEKEKLDKTLDLNRFQFDREFDLKQKAGRREDAMAAIDNEISKFKLTLMRREAEMMGSPEEIKSRQKIADRLAELQVKKAEAELADIEMSPDMRAAFAGFKQRIAAAQARQEEAKAGQEEQTEELQQEVLDKEKKKAKGESSEDEDAAEAGYVPEDLAKDGKVKRGATKYLTGKENDLRARLEKLSQGESIVSTLPGFVSGNTLAVNAFKAIEDYGDDQSGEAAEARKKLRRAAQLGAKLKNGSVGGFFGDSEAVATAGGISGELSNTELNDEEGDELQQLLRDLEDEYGIELVD
jgi:hypothetical protein